MIANPPPPVEEGKTLSARVRQVVILAVGAVWRFAYELYAHSAAARTAGLSEKAVETLAAGGVPDELSHAERCAWRFARQLSADRRIDQPVHDDALEASGTRGLVDILYLIDADHTVLRVPVDPTTLGPAGDAEFVAAIDNADDFCLDEHAGFAYVARHRANPIDRVPPEPRHGSEFRHIAGDPLDEALVGPSGVAWRRGPGDHGRVAYVTTDGGTTAPRNGIVPKAALLRVELQPQRD